MANIIIALATLIIGFVLVSFGAYSSYYAAQRAQVATVVNRALERQLIYVDMVKSDLNTVPTVTQVDASKFSDEDRSGIQFSYGVNGSYGYVCARSPAHEYAVEAFERVAAQWRNAVYGGACDSGGGPAGGFVSVSVRVS